MHRNPPMRRHWLAAALVVLTAQAQAQTAAEPTNKIERVEITGSLIKRIDRATPSVVQSITREDIRGSGYATIDEMLRANSAVDASSIQDGAATGFVGGLSTISLRGFGSQGTLVLINGRRIAPVGAVDINFGRGTLLNTNTIPKGAIDRIDILKDGASALYGSDAMAGVINYVLRKDFEGIEGNVGYSANDKGVGGQSNGGLTFGFGNIDTNRFNIFGGIDVSKRDSVMHSDLKDRGNQAAYDRYLNATASGTTNGLSRFTPDSVASMYSSYYRVPASTAGSSIVNGASVANSSPFGINYLGTLPGCAPENTVGQGVPLRPDGLGPTGPSLRAGQCRFNLDNADEAISAQEKVSGMLRGTFAISNDLTAYADVMVSKTKTTERGVPRTLTTGIFSTATAPSAVTWPKLDGSFLRQAAIVLPVGHPDNPTNGTAQAQPVQLIHRFEDVPSNDISTLQSGRFLVGIEGVVAGWDVDAAVMHSKQENERVQQNRLRASKLSASIASGTYRFGKMNTPEAIASIGSDAINTGDSTITSIDARASRELFKMAGGNAAIAIGAEYRQEELSSVPDANYLAGDYIGLVANGASGERKASAAFTELSLPALKNLELQAALRYEHYSDFGNSTTGKLGFKWAAIPSMLAFRGTAATGFRAPSISQIGDSYLASFHSFQDYAVVDNLRCNNGVSRADPAVLRDCNVLGRTLTNGAGSIPTVVSANRNLKPEESKSFTLGMLISPSKEIDLALDAWYFRRNQEIRVQRGVDIMEAFNADPVANAASVIRDPNPATWLPGIANSGPILALIRQYGNFQYTKTAGLDYELNVRLPAGEWGKFGGKFSGTYTKRFDQLVLAGGTVERLAGISTVDLPKTKASLEVNWKGETASAWTRYNHQDAMWRTTTAGCLSSSSAANVILQQANGCFVGREGTLDIGGAYRGFKDLVISASLLNVTNSYRRSINIPSAFTFWDSGTTAHLGRRFNVSMDYVFK
ncbi:TonB-dependent receptor domain-containing protein [Roseateles asaccharophilus]|uniref:Iron complex outermembrane receptor protein n=1 Tax=Roseateles asaccharophilus TaxID=582607 RepID=A0ABU2A6B6_9BURK|nr:TonB-dependent receptor [Roseateles asaccharophilus]MDR7332737.1 iron complex outermembrane receptor protein [Roseateles asaccharophilus]